MSTEELSTLFDQVREPIEVAVDGGDTSALLLLSSHSTQKVSAYCEGNDKVLYASIYELLVQNSALMNIVKEVVKDVLEHKSKLN